jgi:hypothetical protein
VTRLPERKLNPWGPVMHVAQGEGIYLETEFEMIVAVRLSQVPIGVEVLDVRGAWTWLWLELPAGFHRPDQPSLSLRVDADEPDE